MVARWEEHSDIGYHYEEFTADGQVDAWTEPLFDRRSTPVAMTPPLAREEIKRLRAESTGLRQQAKVHLGQQVEQLGAHDLVERVDELSEENPRLSAAEGQAATENEQLRQRITELEDELTGARTSLRRMIRTQGRAYVPCTITTLSPGETILDLQIVIVVVAYIEV